MIIKSGSLHERILKLLLQRYPVSVSDICSELGVSESMALNKLRELALLGIVSLDPLPDKIYVRLMRTDLKFLGMRSQQLKPIKKSKIKLGKLGSRTQFPQEIYQ